MTEITPKNPYFWLKSLTKFSRPHTIVGTTLSVFALYLLALAIAEIPLTFDNFLNAVAVWWSCFLGNIYIVGLNQLEDIAIDKINKPNLPLAAGEFSPKIGKIIVFISGLVSLLLATYLGKYLCLTVAISLLIGTAYSLPPIRLKRYPLSAALCIFTVRGVIVNLGLYLHFSTQINPNPTIPGVIWLLTLFILIFTVAIAIFKDVPDQEGDRQYQITTLTIIFGQKVVFNLARGVIGFAYLGMILAVFLPLNSVNGWLLLGIHFLLLGIMWLRSLRVDLTDRISIRDFYQFIWKLFFCEYLLFPGVCWLS